MKVQTALVERIKEKGIKQTAIAEATGLGPTAVSRTMSLQRRLTLDEFSAICEFLGVSMDEFRPDETGRG